MAARQLYLGASKVHMGVLARPAPPSLADVKRTTGDLPLPMLSFQTSTHPLSHTGASMIQAVCDLALARHVRMHLCCVCVQEVLRPGS